ncbi:MAG: nucleotide exchange factor GrpE [Candidatus Paceibacterota bacterium]|jgi:molecular chaperone GrpE
MMKQKDETENVNDIEPIKGSDSGSNEFLDDSVVAEENATEAIKKLKEKLKTCEAEKTEYLVGWQRAKADQINARKREEEERKEFIKFSNERLIESLIPVLESFDMAIGNKVAWEKVDQNWRTGVEYIYSQLKKVLSDVGLQEINPEGDAFDHNRDEAIEYVPAKTKAEHHKILSVVQKGYSLNNKSLRPPKVKVGEWKE